MALAILVAMLLLSSVSASASVSAQPVTLQTNYGSVASNADWVAWRDGSGSWTKLAGAGGRYTFDVTRRSYTLAVLCFERFGPVLTFYRFGAAELPMVHHACERRFPPSSPTIEVHGHVLGLDGYPVYGRAWVGAAGSVAVFERQGADGFDLNVPDQDPLDAVVFRSVVGQPPDRAWVARDLGGAPGDDPGDDPASELGSALRGPSLAASGAGDAPSITLDVDLDGPDSVALETFDLLVSDANGRAPPPGVSVMARLHTCGGVVATVDASPTVTTAETPVAQARYAALPASARDACDRYQLIGLWLGREGEGVAYVTSYRTEPADVRLTLPRLPPPPTWSGGGPDAALSVRWAPQPAATVYLAGGQAGASFSPSVTPRWTLLQGAAPPTAFRLPVPAELPGWPSALRFDAPRHQVAFGVLRSDAAPAELLDAYERDVIIGTGPYGRGGPVAVDFDFSLRSGEHTP